MLGSFGATVVMNFIYTSCALPQFCCRMTNHLSVLQNRFAGRDLVLLSITFDPARDARAAGRVSDSMEGRRESLALSHRTDGNRFTGQQLGDLVTAALDR
jgi:hypothetical protein